MSKFRWHINLSSKIFFFTLTAVRIVLRIDFKYILYNHVRMRLFFLKQYFFIPFKFIMSST